MLTSCSVTGFCEVFASSWIVFWSCRRSFLQPTRMMGRPLQKCMTSETHCDTPLASYSVGARQFATVGSLYLLLHVLQRIGGINGEADQDNVGVGVRERTKTIVILLTSRIPKSELNVLAVDLNIGNVVLEDGGDVDLDESRVSYRCPRLVVRATPRHALRPRKLGSIRTSGKVPLEKTLQTDTRQFHRLSLDCRPPRPAGAASRGR